MQSLAGQFRVQPELAEPLGDVWHVAPRVRLVGVAKHINRLSGTQLRKGPRMKQRRVVGPGAEEVAGPSDRHCQVSADMHGPQLVGQLHAQCALPAARALGSVFIERAGCADGVDVVEYDQPRTGAARGSGGVMVKRRQLCRPQVIRGIDALIDDGRTGGRTYGGLAIRDIGLQRLVTRVAAGFGRAAHAPDAQPARQ